MTKERRQQLGITDDQWKLGRSICNEAIVGGRVRYNGISQGVTGEFAIIEKVVRSERMISIRLERNGQSFRAFAHNLTFA